MQLNLSFALAIFEKSALLQSYWTRLLFIFIVEASVGRMLTFKIKCYNGTKVLQNDFQQSEVKDKGSTNLFQFLWHRVNADKSLIKHHF